MKVLLVLFALVAVAHAWHRTSEYCPTNPRRAGESLSGENLPEFSFLLTCPTGQPAYAPQRIVDFSDREWTGSFIDLDAADYREMANDELLNFQSLVSNGVVDPQQQACAAWDHAFLADNQAKLLATGSGLPIIVAQDRRYGGEYGKAGLNYGGLNEIDFGNLMGFNHTHLSNETQVGQWLYSVCLDASCASASVPKPFWGRRIGAPLYQDTMAELAYFPVNPDWAYNSPKLGTSYPGQGPDSFGTVAPKHIASTYVYSATGEKILVLLLNGDKVGKETPTADSSYPDFNTTRTEWFLVYCQDEDCSSWGIFDLAYLPVLRGSPELQAVFQGNTFAPGLATSPDGRSIYVITTDNGPAIQAQLTLRSLNKNAAFRNAAMQEIYTSLIGRPTGVDQAPHDSNIDYNTTVDFAIYNGYFSEDYSNGLTDHPLNYMYGYRGLLPRSYFNAQNAPFSERRPAVACTDLEAAGIDNDPWCHWNYYWQVDRYNTRAGIPPIELMFQTPVSTYFQLYTECDVDGAQSLYTNFRFMNLASPFVVTAGKYFVSFELLQPIVPQNVHFEDSYDGGFGIPLPIPGAQPVGVTFSEVLNQPFPNQRYDKDVDTSMVYTGQRYQVIQGANGQAFFTWADLDGSLLDTAMTWGVCALVNGVQAECRTILDSLELGTMGYLESRHGSTVLLRAPDGLPVMVYWFDHFGGYLNQPIADERVSIAAGQTTSKPLIVMCLDALCNAASVSAFAPAQMADVANPRSVNNGTWINNGQAVMDVLRSVNPTVNGDAAFVGDELMLLMNEGGRNGEYANNPIRLWRTNRWASPTGLPCSEANAGQSVVANDVVYYCSKLQIGSHDAELYLGTIPRPWTRLYEWIKMDWGFGLRNLGGFLGWGANRDDAAFNDIATDKDPWWTDNANDWLNAGPARYGSYLNPATAPSGGGGGA